MSETTPTPAQLVKELKVSAHLMTLQAGVFCVYHAAGSTAPDPVTGLPGARLTLPPGPSAQHVTIRSFRDDGWLGGPDTAALVRVAQGPAQILMTVYMLPDAPNSAPKLQVMRLSEAPPPPSVGAPTGEGETIKGGTDADGAANPPEVAAHIQVRGDVLGHLGEWMGEPGSQRWIEGFAVMPHGDVGADQLEYQAVLGRGWLSPWAEGGNFCGSRGMALPILGLRVRLRGAALATHNIELSATFTDGTAVGPVAAGEPCEAASLAPLEAFQVVIRKIDAQSEALPKFGEAEEVKKRKRVVKEALPPAKLFRARPR
jgi:hypothetical protein